MTKRPSLMSRLSDLTIREPVAVGATFVALLIMGVSFYTGADPQVYVATLVATVGIFLQVRQAVTPYMQVLEDALREQNESEA